MDNKRKKYFKYAFIYDRPTSYIGGYNYLYNLLYSLNISGISRRDIIIFCPEDLSSNKITELRKFAELKKCSYLTKWRINWFINRIFYGLFFFSPYLFFYENKYKFKFTYFGHWNGRKLFHFKQIYWLPDVQYLIYPENFSKNFIKKENEHIKKQFLYSNKIIVSSNTIKKQIIKNFKLQKKELEKIEVMHFYSSIIHNDENQKIIKSIGYLNEKYELSKGYLYCPNQFWAHKNHYRLIEAFHHIINDNNYKNLKLVFSGSRFFKKNDSYFYDKVINLINDLNLNNNIIHFENLDLNSIKALYIGCLAVINPSLYEGWSTTIEEARSYNLNLLISNIEVNREQNCPNSIFFLPLFSLIYYFGNK